MDFPKINVSSKEDIQYITQIWRTALLERLEQQYGHDGTPRFLEEVQSILDQWLENMIKMASSNISINGIPYEEAIMNDDVEPLDESLGRKLQIQQIKLEEMQLLVAERRKRVPESVKMLLDDAIRRQSALADSIEFEGQDEELDSSKDMDEDITLVRSDLAMQEYTASMAHLSSMRKTVSSHITRLENAEDVTDSLPI